MKKDYDLQGKVALIFGGSSGIGLATAQALYHRGAICYNASRHTAPSYDNNKSGSLSLLRSIKTDCSKPGDIEKAIDQVVAERGQIDILIYSAGYSLAGPMEHITTDDMQYLMSVNFMGACHSAKCAVKHMRRSGGGKIIFVSSIAGVTPIVFDAYYSASKAGLNMFSLALGLEVKRYNIDVSTVMPGGTATDFTYKRKYYIGESAGSYDSQVRRAADSLVQIEQCGACADDVATCIIETLHSPTPLTAHNAKNSTFVALGNILPKKLSLALVNKTFNQT